MNEKLENLIAVWDEARDQGEELSVEDLCAESPELVDEARIHIERLRAMDWLDSVDELPSGRKTHPVVPSLGMRVPATLGGRYQLKSMIAEGGFGQVWESVDTALQRAVAVKVTTVECYTEARRVAQLKHHGIISVHDVGNEEGFCYIVFDLVDGTNLAERIKQGGLSWQDSACLVAQVAEHLQYAHDKGFIHRDIKPANILLDRQGHPVLADFGIAVTECELRHETMTSVGTLAYMSPEQLTKGVQLDHRTDVYSLGVVLYELLMGRLPFVDSTVAGLRKRILTDEPLFDKELPAELERICSKCLSKNAADRFSTAGALAEELQRMLR